MKTTTRKCKYCGQEFITNQPLYIFCKKECQVNNYKKLTGYDLGRDVKISTSTAGEISELIVIADLLAKGYSMFKAVSRNCFCDIVAIKNDVVLKIEVKTGSVNERTSQLTFAKSKHSFDLYAICDRKTRNISYVDMKGVKKELK